MLVFFYLSMLILQINSELEKWNNRVVVVDGKQFASEVSPVEDIIKSTEFIQVLRKPKKVETEIVPQIYIQEDSEFPLEKFVDPLLDNRDAEICGQSKGIKRSLPEIIESKKFNLNEVNTYKTINNNKKAIDGYKQKTDKKSDQTPENMTYLKKSNKSYKVKFKKLKKKFKNNLNKTLEKRQILTKGSLPFLFGSKSSLNQSSNGLPKKSDSFYYGKNNMSFILQNSKNNHQANSIKSASVLKHRHSAKREINLLFNVNRQVDDSPLITSNESISNVFPSNENEVNYREKSMGENKPFCETNIDKLLLPIKALTEETDVSTANIVAESSENNVVSLNSNTSSIPSEIHTVKREYVGVECEIEVNKNHNKSEFKESTACDRTSNDLGQYGVTEKLVKKGTTEDVCINIFQALNEKKNTIEETANDEGVYTSSKSVRDSSTIFTQTTNGTNSAPVTTVFWSNFFDSNAVLKVTASRYMLDNAISSTSQNDNPKPVTNTDTVSENQIIYLTDTVQTDSYSTESNDFKETIIPTPSSNINPTQYKMPDKIKTVTLNKQFESSETSIITSLDFSKLSTEPELPNSENIKYCLSLFKKINLISTTPSFDDSQIKKPTSYFELKDEKKMANMYPNNEGFAASCNPPRSERPKFTFFPDEQNEKVTSDSIYYDFHINKANKGPQHTLSFVSGASSSKTSNKTFDAFILKLANQSHVFQKANSNTKSQLLKLNHDEFKKAGSTLPLLKRILGLTTKRQTKILPSATLSVEECITLKVHPVRHKGGDPGNHYHHGHLEPTICENPKKHVSKCVELTPNCILESSKGPKTLTTCPPHRKTCDECEVNDLKDILPQKVVSTQNLLNQQKNKQNHFL